MKEKLKILKAAILILLLSGCTSKMKIDQMADCPIVGNTDSFIYHVRGGQFYDMMIQPNAGHDNRVCFYSEEEAKQAKYRKSLR